ncbi:MAG TPA: hypothetical protein DFR83_06950 [Deltaproteobacteria bacterium]|nr:hypothetical protein [Deltaproteobacteria bacterium]
MRIDAHPLVVAAALGLLGPAALADDDPITGLVGEWARADDAPMGGDSLGASFEVIPVEEHFVVGGGESRSHGVWTRTSDQRAWQVLEVDGVEVQRSLSTDGDVLVVRTHVPANEHENAREIVERFNRRG